MSAGDGGFSPWRVVSALGAAAIAFGAAMQGDPDRHRSLAMQYEQEAQDLEKKLMPKEPPK